MFSCCSESCVVFNQRIQFNSHVFNILEGNGNLVVKKLDTRYLYKAWFRESKGYVFWPESDLDMQLLFGWVDFYWHICNELMCWGHKFKFRNDFFDTTMLDYMKNIFFSELESVLFVWFFSSCNQCGRSSALPSRFYELELNIQGHKNLTECVTEFLKVNFILYHTHTEWIS